MNLAVPTSTTIHLEVAVLYSHDEGVMLEMERDDDGLRYLDCSWLSCSVSDAERLFVGDHELLRIEGIAEIGTDINYKHLMHAIGIFDACVSGKISHADSAKKDEQIISALIANANTNGNEYDEYINALFLDFCRNKREIKLSTWNIQRYYESMQRLLFHGEVQRLCLLSNVTAIFPNAKRVSIEYYQYAKPSLDASFLVLFLGELGKITKQNQKNLLVQLEHVQFEEKVIDEFKSAFMTKSWLIEANSKDHTLSIFKVSRF